MSGLDALFAAMIAAALTLAVWQGIRTLGAWWGKDG